MSNLSTEFTIDFDDREVADGLNRLANNVAATLNGLANTINDLNLSNIFSGLVVTPSLEEGKLLSQLESMGGKTKAQAQEILNISKDIFNDAANAATLQETTSLVSKAAKHLEQDIQDVSDTALRLNQVYQADAEKVIYSVQQLTTKLGLSSKEATDFISTGFSDGLNASGDFLDSILEYTVQFQELGASAEQFYSVLSSGQIVGGLLGTDRVTDFFKEGLVGFGDALSSQSKEAYSRLGIDADEFIANINNGSVSAVESVQKIINKLKGVKSKTEQAALGAALFGSQYDDMGATVVAGIDISSKKMSDLAGSTNTLKSSNNNALDKMGSAWRSLQSAILNSGIYDLVNNITLSLANLLKSVADFLKENPRLTAALTAITIGAGALAAAATSIAVGMRILPPLFIAVRNASLALLGTLRAVSVQMLLIVAPIIAAFEAWEFLSGVLDNSKKKLGEYNKKLNEVRANSKLDMTSNLAKQIEGKTKAQLEKLKNELVEQSKVLNEAEGALYQASVGFKPLDTVGVGWQIGGLNDAELAQNMQQIDIESEKVRKQLGAVSSELSKIKAVDIETKKLKVEIPDNQADILSFFDSLNSLNNTTADEKILQVNSALKETLATINGDTDPQKIILANQTAMDAIVNIEQEKAAKSIELAERTYTAKADYIQKNQADEQGNKLTATQQAEQLKQAAQELATARVAASQQALDATRSHLSQAKTDYDSYAQKVRELEQAIVEEKSRQSQTLRDLERAGMSGYAAFQDKKKELASLSSEFERVMQERNYSKAQEIAKKREALAKSLASAGDVKDDSGDVLISKEDARRQAVDAVKDSYAQVNEAMVAQKQVAEENANSQKTYVDNLQKQVEVIEGIVASVQQKEIDLKLNVSMDDLDQQLIQVQEKLKRLNFVAAVKVDQSKISQSADNIVKDKRIIMYTADVSTEKAKEKLQALQSETAQETIKQKLIYQKDANFTDDEKSLNSPAQKVVVFNPDTSQFDTVLARISKNTESVHTIKVKEVGESGGSDLPAFATGGHVRGAGTGTSDSILARLSDGEFIIPAAAVKNYGVDFLNSLRSQKFNLPAFATGGIVSNGMNVLNKSAGGGGIGQVVNNYLNEGGAKDIPVSINIQGTDKPISAKFSSTDDIRNLTQALKKMGMAR